jgi:tyrosinase
MHLTHQNSITVLIRLQESLFLTWHRPFILLFEQVLVEHAQRLAKRYPAKYRQQYIDAANSLRSPYWDWAASDIPNAVVPRMVRVKIPNYGSLKTITIENPLYTYTFPKAALDGKYGDWDDEGRARMYRCSAPDRFPSSANTLLDGRPYKQWVVSI